MKAFHKFLIILITLAVVLFTILGIAAPQLNNPEDPERIPGYSEVVPAGLAAPQIDRILDPVDAGPLIQPKLAVVRVTDNIITIACPEGHPTCRVVALFRWVRSTIDFAEVIPTRDHVISPAETILLRQGKNIDKSILLASMLRAEGFPSKIGITAYSTFVETTLNENTVRMDMSCGHCRYGEISYEGPEEHIKWIQ